MTIQVPVVTVLVTVSVFVHLSAVSYSDVYAEKG